MTVSQGDIWLDKLYQEKSGMVLRRLRYMCYNDSFDMSVAEDLLHEVFLLTKVKLYDSDLVRHPNIDGWLVQAATNLYRNERRRRLSQIANEEPLDARELHSTDDFLQSFTLEGLLSVLTKEEYLLLYERAIEGFTIAELSAKYDVSNGSIKVRLHRIKRKIANLMKAENL